MVTWTEFIKASGKVPFNLINLLSIGMYCILIGSVQGHVYPYLQELDDALHIQALSLPVEQASFSRVQTPAGINSFSSIVPIYIFGGRSGLDQCGWVKIDQIVISMEC